jgi:hypothetical protein
VSGKEGLQANVCDGWVVWSAWGEQVGVSLCGKPATASVPVSLRDCRRALAPETCCCVHISFI